MPQSFVPSGTPASPTRGRTIFPELSPSSGGGQLRVLTRIAMREALLGAERGQAPERTVRAVVRQACEEARACGARVEHVLILLKEAHHELPEARCMHPDDAHDTLSRVITLCIDEYYGPRPPD